MSNQFTKINNKKQQSNKTNKDVSFVGKTVFAYVNEKAKQSSTNPDKSSVIVNSSSQKSNYFRH